MAELKRSFLILLLSLVPGSSLFGLMSFVTLGFTSTSLLLLLRLLNLSVLVRAFGLRLNVGGVVL